MKQVNFSHSGGFPLEQETLERLQTAYRFELYEALKAHLSIETNKNYIISLATNEKTGWAVIHENGEGTLYPIQEGTNTGYLKTTRKGTNLVYGTGVSQIAYFDYEAEYISESEFINGTSENNDLLTVYYYDLQNFNFVKDLKTIEQILQAIGENINAIESNIDVIEADIDLINQSYLPLNGSKAMQGNLDLGTHQLSKLDITEGTFANVRVADFKFGSIARRGLLHPNDPTGRVLVDSSNQSTTNLALNYESDWENTIIGGKVFLENVNTTSSDGSLLILDNYNQIIKSNTLIDSLLDRITALENKPATAVPIGMIAIWGKPAPFPEGWEEYTPLRGRMPVGLYNPNSQERGEQQDADRGNGITYYRDSNGFAVFPFETIGNTDGRIGKKLSINEIPPHTHTETRLKDNTSNNTIHYESVGDDHHAGYESVASGSAGGGQSFSILNPYRVVQFIEYTGRPSDVTAPTNPTNLTVSNIGNTNLTLNWTASSDEYGVTNYLIYKNDTLLTTLGNVLSYNVTALSSGTSYSFYIKAKDAGGNLSDKSNIENATTTIVDTIVPTTPEYITCYLVNDGNQITVDWTTSTDNVGIERYEVWRRTYSGTSQLLLTTSGNTCTVSGTVNTTYYFKVRARDAAGNVSEFTSEVAETIEGNSCFDVESLVTMASGQSKKLKNIVIGDKLQGLSFPNEIDESDGDYMSWNGKLNEAVKAEVTVVNKITSIQPDYYEVKTADTTIRATGQHPLLVTEDGENLKWVCVKNVVQSMLLIDKAGRTKPIESILFKEEPLEVALLDVENVDNYIISGIVAHNNKPLDPVDPQL